MIEDWMEGRDGRRERPNISGVKRFRKAGKVARLDSNNPPHSS